MGLLHTFVCILSLLLCVSVFVHLSVCGMDDGTVGSLVRLGVVVVVKILSCIRAK